MGQHQHVAHSEHSIPHFLSFLYQYHTSASEQMSAHVCKDRTSSACTTVDLA